MVNEERVSPRLIPGFRDLGPREALLKRRILEIVIEVFERFGFDPFESATVHKETVLFGSDEWTDMDYFRAWNSARKEREGRDKIALRFDLTVALGRYVAENIKTISRPFARWQVGNVFRGESPREGRFCEFTQCDADIVFAPGVSSDAQIVSLISAVMKALNVPAFEIRVNHRQILNGLTQVVGFPDEYFTPILRILDKRDKEGEEGVRASLIELSRPGSKPKEKIRILTDQQVEKLVAFTNIRGSTGGETLDLVREFMAEVPSALQGVDELEQIVRLALLGGVETENLVVDLSMVRGLGYYTGPIFETVLTDPVGRELDLGAVFAGGRYDDLVDRFTEANVPATGASFGIDRFTVFAEASKLFDDQQTVTDVLVAYQPQALDFAVQVAAQLRDANLKVRLYDGEDLSFRNQIGHASQLDIPCVILLGGSEVESGLVTVKDMRRRTQASLSISAAIEKIFDEILY